MMFLIIASVAGAPEPDTLDSYACDTSCMASNLSRAGEVVWYEQPTAVHPSESESDGSLRTSTRLVRRNGVQALEQSPGCRQIVVEDLGSKRLVRTTHRLDPNGVCVEVDSYYGRAVTVEQAPERVSPVKVLASVATQVGLTLDARTSLPWEADFGSVTTLGEACQAVASQARLEGADIRFGIRHGSLIVFHASQRVNRPLRAPEDIQRDSEEHRLMIAEIKAAEATAAEVAEGTE